MSDAERLATVRRLLRIKAVMRDTCSGAHLQQLLAEIERCIQTICGEQHGQAQG